MSVLQASLISNLSLYSCVFILLSYDEKPCYVQAPFGIPYDLSILFIFCPQSKSLQRQILIHTLIFNLWHQSKCLEVQIQIQVLVFILCRQRLSLRSTDFSIHTLSTEFKSQRDRSKFC